MKSHQESQNLLTVLGILVVIFVTSACRAPASPQVQVDSLTTTAVPLIEKPITETPPPPTTQPTPTSTPICLATLPAASAPSEGTGGKISFSSYRDGESEIYMIDADGSNLTRLTDLDDRVGQPVWSPDGQRIAFVRRIQGMYMEIWGMNADGGEMAHIPTNQQLVDTEPAWSPDGSQIAFTSNIDSYPDYRGRQVIIFNLFVVNADGSGLLRLTEGRNLDTSPDWSPDGTRIAYQSNRVGNFEIYTLPVGGVTPKNLTNRLTDETDPAWSPDGSKIAFVTDRDGNEEIYVMDANGENQTRLTDHPLEDKAPSWSPDGQSIAFYSNRDGNYEIYKMKADGSELNRLTDHYNFDGFPSWQPGISSAITLLQENIKVIANRIDCLDGNLIP